VNVWRVDWVYLDATGGPWIATQSAADGSGNVLTAHLAHRAARLLGRLGV
jgi:hypothetical protein